MKKYAGKVLAAAMAVSMMVPGMNVMAATQSNNTETTTVKYGVTTSYEWSVPSEIDFTNAAEATVKADQASGKTQKVKVTKNVIPEGQKLQITAKGNGSNDAFTIAAKGDGKAHTLAYTINVGDGSEALKVNGVVLEVPAATNTKDVALTFKLTKDSVEMADNYEGTVTYTSSVVNASK